MRSMSKVKTKIKEWGENSNGKVNLMRTLVGEGDNETVMLIN